MNLFGFHFCADELQMLILSAPFIGAGLAWFRLRWRRLRGTA